MTATISKSQVDLWQGDTEIHGPSAKMDWRPFGYVHGEGGGFFFTWHNTLEATLASVEEDETDGDGGLSKSIVVEFLREYLPTTVKGRKMWGDDED